MAGFWGDQTRPDSEDYVFRGVRTGVVEPPEGFGPDDFRVATFREVAERFPHHVLDVEIKLQRGPDGSEDDLATGVAAAEVLAAEIAELGREDSVIVACFNDERAGGSSTDLAPSVATTPGEAALLGWFTGGAALDDRDLGHTGSLHIPGDPGGDSRHGGPRPQRGPGSVGVAERY